MISEQTTVKDRAQIQIEIDAQRTGKVLSANEGAIAAYKAEVEKNNEDLAMYEKAMTVAKGKTAFDPEMDALKKRDIAASTANKNSQALQRRVELGLPPVDVSSADFVDGQTYMIGGEPTTVAEKDIPHIVRQINAGTLAYTP